MDQVVSEYEHFVMEQQFAHFAKNKQVIQERLLQQPHVNSHQADTFNVISDPFKEGTQYLEYVTHCFARDRSGKLTSSEKVFH